VILACFWIRHVLRANEASGASSLGDEDDASRVMIVDLDCRSVVKEFCTMSMRERPMRFSDEIPVNWEKAALP